MSSADAPLPPAPPLPVRWRRYLALIGPHLVTLIVSLLLFTALHYWFLPTPSPSGPQFVTATPAPTIPPTPIPTPLPTVPAAPLDDGLIRLTILDLQAENARLRAATLLLRAAITIDEAVSALQRNDFAEADRALMSARRALDRAYQLSVEPQKGPIDTIRLQMSQIRDDLGIRPEGADRRLWQVRRLILTLVDE